MVVRLAYMRGYLTTRNPSRMQTWGLVYYVYMDRRQYNEDVRWAQELQTFELAIDRWRQLHALVDEAEQVDGEQYTGVQDPRELDEWLRENGNRLEGYREMNASELQYYGMEV